MEKNTIMNIKKLSITTMILSTFLVSCNTTNSSHNDAQIDSMINDGYASKEISHDIDIYRGYGSTIQESLDTIHQLRQEDKKVTLDINDIISQYTKKMAFVCPGGTDQIPGVIQHKNEDKIISSLGDDYKSILDYLENKQQAKAFQDNPESSWFVSRNIPGTISYEEFKNEGNIDLCSRNLFDKIGEVKQDSLITFEYENDKWVLSQIHQPKIPEVTYGLGGENFEDALYAEGEVQENYITMSVDEYYPEQDKIGIVCRSWVDLPEEYFNTDIFFEDERFDKENDWIVTEKNGELSFHEYPLEFLCSDRAFRGFTELNDNSLLTFGRTIGKGWELIAISEKN